jgi:hypothetical protein
MKVKNFPAQTDRHHYFHYTEFTTLDSRMNNGCVTLRPWHLAYKVS